MRISGILLAAALGLGALAQGALAQRTRAPRAADAPAPMSSEFAIKLYQKLAGEEGNIFVSPISIESALAMAAAGAKGQTKDQMLGVLALKDPLALADTMRALTRDPQVVRQREHEVELPRTQLRIANALWAQQAYPFEPAYIKSVNEAFGAEAQSLDFGQPQAARKVINDWVEKQTEGKIVNLLPEGAINPLTRLVLTNAVYFKATWADQFSKSRTEDAPFHLAGGKSIEVPTMRQQELFGYHDAGKLHVLSLRYADHRSDMLLLVPKEKDGLAAIEKSLSPETYAEWTNKLSRREIDLSMPKFEMTQTVGLGDVLKSMGMTDAFDAEKADFSGMSTAEKLAISAVLHKAYVKVDEEGTEAAAATAVMIAATAARVPEEPLRIEVDRPFLFVIRSTETGAILFIGRVSNPG